MVGETMADVVTWKWIRAWSTWGATLPDGTRLRAELIRRRGRGRSYWRAWLVSEKGGNQVVIDDRFNHPDAAQEAILAEYKRRRDG